MNIKLFFTQTGTLVGETIENLNGSYTVKNPVVIVPHGNQMGLVPLLAFVEETSINLCEEDITYHKSFEPNIDIKNEYNKLFGSGIVVPNSKLN